MQVIEIKSKDGRKFRIVAENKSQEKRILKKFHENENLIDLNYILSGIHNVAQFEKLIDDIY